MYKIIHQILNYLKFFLSQLYDTISSELFFTNVFHYFKQHGLRGVISKISYLFTRSHETGFSYLNAYYGNKLNYQNYINVQNNSFELKTKISNFSYQPLISIILPTYNSNFNWLSQCIQSVKDQIYSNWELCIADDASDDQELIAFIKNLKEADSRIKVVLRSENGHISKSSNSALELVTGEFVALLDHDDLLSNDALFWLIDAMNKNPDACLFYSDEDKINSRNKRMGPYFKSNWNYHLFLSHNLISHLGVYKTDILKKIGGFRVGYEGSQDYDLALRFIERINSEQIIHIPRVLYHWRIHKNSTALKTENKPYAVFAAKAAIQDHFDRNGIYASVEITPNNAYQVKYLLNDPLPKISIIIPSRNNEVYLRKCINSILNKTSYQNFEIAIIDNNSDDAKTLKLLEEVRNYSKVKIYRDPQDFNYSAINNLAAEKVNGEYICFLNDDTEVISKNWLEEMLGIFNHQNVGVVGAKLWYSNKTLQHGGIILGIGGVASHAHKFFPEGNGGYFGRADLIQEFSAVTGACLMVPKSLFHQLGGFNETDLKIAYNDVDFCLRVKESGYSVVWTPMAELFHHEGISRGDDLELDENKRFQGEINYMHSRWGKWIENDPAYSPNLSLSSENFGIAWPSRLQ